MVSAFTVLPIVFTVIAFLLVAGRAVASYVTQAAPPWRWAWLPGAIVLALSMVSDGIAQVLGATPTFTAEGQAWLDMLRFTADAVLAFMLAYQQGHQPPPQAPAPTASKSINRFGPVLLVLLAAALLGGCAPSLERSRTAGIEARGTAAPTAENRSECEKTDRRRAGWAAVAAGAAALTGGAGLATIPAKTDEAETALAASAVGALAVSVGAEIPSAQAASEWARECSR